MSKPKFENPYLPPLDLQCFNTDIGRSDYRFIQSVRPQQGTVTTTINLLWKALVNELKLRGITSFEQSDLYEQFVGNIKLITTDEFARLTAGSGGVPNGASSGTLPQTDAPNDGRGVEGVRPGSPPDETSVSDVQSKSGGKVKRGKKGKGTAEGGP